VRCPPKPTRRARRAAALLDRRPAEVRPEAADKARDARRGLDFADLPAVAKWLGDLYDRFGDVDAIVADMLAPPEARELGPVLHAANYAEAREAILDAFVYAGIVMEPDDAPDAPSGGNPTTHE
jgi:hypothetical protein